LFHSRGACCQVASFPKKTSPAPLHGNQIKTRTTTDHPDFTDKTMEQPAEFANPVCRHSSSVSSVKSVVQLAFLEHQKSSWACCQLAHASEK
jgi:hypothetical protein